MGEPVSTKDWADKKAEEICWRKFGDMVSELSWVFRDYQKRIDELENQVVQLKQERSQRDRSTQ